jgi:hypothetical protein
MTDDTHENPETEQSKTSDPKPDGGGHFSSMTLLLGGFFLIVFYILSVGPVAAIVDSRHLPDWIEMPLKIFYYPLIWLYGNVEVCHKYLGAYAEWWSDLF